MDKTVRIAILHGGPADRQQHVVERFSDNLHVALFKPFMPVIGDAYARLDIDRANYRLVMRPVDMRDFSRDATTPSQEVALYVYAGIGDHYGRS